jgi:hypothetical protein
MTNPEVEIIGMHFDVASDETKEAGTTIGFDQVDGGC